MTHSLFAQPQTWCLPDADLSYWPGFLSAQEADFYLHTLQSSLAWQQDSIRLFGEFRKIPRLQAWYGDQGGAYSYSGTRLTASHWTPALESLRDRIEQATGHRFNSVLANLYRDGNDSMGWHADDEPELGDNPVIVSLTLGETRDFKLRHKTSKDQVKIALSSGSLLIMAGATQHCWQHSIAKSRKPCGVRINLTFRRVF